MRHRIGLLHLSPVHRLLDLGCSRPAMKERITVSSCPSYPLQIRMRQAIAQHERALVANTCPEAALQDLLQVQIWLRCS